MPASRARAEPAVQGAPRSPAAAPAMCLQPAPPGSRSLLALGTLATGDAPFGFAMPAHGLCIVTGVLQGGLAIEAPDGTWQPLPAWTVQGPQTLARRWRAAPGTRVVSTLMRGHLFAERLGLPAAAFRDRWAPAGLQSDLIATLAEGEAANVSRGALRDARRRSRAVAALAAARSVTEAARELGLGERALQRLCDRDLGLPPVVVARLMRMHRCAARGLARGGLTAEDALAHGYADQAHMARDFRRLGGMRPRDLAGDDGWTLRESARRIVPAWAAQADASDSSKT